jgi:HSP20 family protein
MVIRVRDPFATLVGLQRAMDSVMSSDWFGSRTSGSGAFPLINVFNDGDDFVVVAELPGVKKEDLDIQVRGDNVRIRG